MTTFIHTADWQLGMTWARLSSEAQARYSGDRIGTIRRLAASIPAEFMVVAGDVFEHHNVSAADIGRACGAMADTGIPIYLLPGNHDPLHPGSLWDSPTFTSNKPDNVHVLAEPVIVGDVEIVPVPWRAKNPDEDLVGPVVDGLGEKHTAYRVLVAHGMLDLFEPDRMKDPIRLEQLREAIATGVIDYVALGDRHIGWIDDETGMIAYSGTHEVTSLRERSRGTAIGVDLAAKKASLHTVGIWEFLDIEARLESDLDLDEFESQFRLSDRDTTVIRTALTGSLSLSQAARLDTFLASQEPLFAALYAWERNTNLDVYPDEADVESLELSGFAASGLEQLSNEAPSSPVARNALRLLYRLARS